MTLDREKVRDCVIESLREVVGAETVPAINEQTDPICGLGLDSADGVALACSLSDKLNFDIPEDINPLVDDAVRRSRRVGEIVDLVQKLVSGSGGSSNG